LDEFWAMASALAEGADILAWPDTTLPPCGSTVCAWSDTGNDIMSPASISDRACPVVRPRQAPSWIFAGLRIRTPLMH
jgi:hypothetical protein